MKETSSIADTEIIILLFKTITMDFIIDYWPKDKNYIIESEEDTDPEFIKTEEDIIIENYNEYEKELKKILRDNKYKRGIRKIITDEELSFEDKNLIKEVIKKLIEFTSSYEKKEVLEFSNTRWL